MVSSVWWAPNIGAKNPFDMTDEELAEATELLRQQREVMRYYWTDQSTVEQGLATGELIASYAWNSSIKPLKEQGILVEYMNPKEGIYTWVCGQVLISTGNRDEDKAYDYLNAALDPAVGAWIMENYGYGYSNKRSFDLVDEQTKADLGFIDPEAFMTDARYFREIPLPHVRSTSRSSTRSKPASKPQAYVSTRRAGAYAPARFSLHGWTRRLSFCQFLIRGVGCRRSINGRIRTWEGF